MTYDRPKYLDIPKIRQSVTAVLSIMHRISGVAMFVMLPAALWLLDLSLRVEDSFNVFAGFFGNPLVKIIFWLLLWGFIHHAFAGVRFLLMDMHKGIDKATAQKSAKGVIVAAFVVALIMGVILW